ncbi:hypothetical protein LJ737_00825 [Hymenobacter sp. 15J16-1T3B]|uniref:hypothetical protein n=1 Tax=Hymenobacter sp. 15J16-1T3B TaxID=2886941 RepID=UPI001D12F182|nr:hypothetical protein [Hymenobacter sp. 15J16-1T3B]MCC3155760.1 hypothetical protein [Hymenobacter sp. 15J16-1T3B]
MPFEGFAVPVDGIEYRAFLLGFFPVHSRNSLSPRLVLYPAHLAIKVIGTSQYEYTALRQVGYRPERFLSRAKIELRCQDGARYYLTLGSAAVERDLLQFFRNRGLPLTAAAAQVLDAPGGTG